MSCSSKNTELRTSLEQFEERIRALTLKNSDADKKYENLLTRQRELEEEKSAIEKQMQKKDSEINDLNTKLNEKVAELQSVNSDKRVADEQIKEYKSQSDTLASKNSVIEKLQQQGNELKQTYEEEINRLKKELETAKANPAAQNNPVSSTNDSKSSFLVPPVRFHPLDRLSNLTQEVKAQLGPEVANLKDKVLSAFGFSQNASASTVTNQGQPQQQQLLQQERQNVPAPPLADNAQRRQQPGHVESAQAAPQLANADQGAAADQAQDQNNLNRLTNNRNAKILDFEEVDDEEQRLNLENAQDHLAENNPSHDRFNRKNYRINDRPNVRLDRNQFPREQRIENIEDFDENDNQADARPLRNRNTM